MRFASGLTALLLLTGTNAGAKPADKARARLADQLAAEHETIDRTLVTVGDKLSVADAQRVRRVRAAYRILRTPLASDASEAERLASARRRAAARLLLERDKAERALLASEAAQLRATRLTKIEATAKIPTIEIPEDILRPGNGSIARRFGTLQHERSKATLSRRGIDFEVDLHGRASAPADGVVRYSGPIRGLDHGVIMDHGDYFTVVAKLEEVAIPAGTRVQRGDRIGRAARHRIYLELRAKVSPGGLPIDPEPMLAE